MASDFVLIITNNTFYTVMPFNRYSTIQDTWTCGRFVYVRFVTVFRYNSCLCATVISVDSVLKVWLRIFLIITSFYCFTLLVLHIPVLCLWSFIFRSCIFSRPHYTISSQKFLWPQNPPCTWTYWEVFEGCYSGHTDCKDYICSTCVVGILKCSEEAPHRVSYQ